MNACLYIHYRATDLVPFYVGIGSPRRPYSSKNRSNHWHNTVKKHGLIILIRHTGLDWETACNFERAYIKRFGRRANRTGTLVNLTNGGDGVLGYRHNESSREIISAKSIRSWNLASEPEKDRRLNGFRDPAIRAKRYISWCASMHNLWQDPAYREKQRLSRSIGHSNPSVAASKSVKMKAYWAKRRQPK